MWEKIRRWMEYNLEYFKFHIDRDDTDQFILVFGVQSSDDIIQAPNATLYTQNDFELLFRKEDRRYVMNVETVYRGISEFDTVDYLLRIYKAFTGWMETNGYSTERKLALDQSLSFCMDSDRGFDSIEEAYSVFRNFITGYLSQYKKAYLLEEAYAD